MGSGLKTAVHSSLSAIVIAIIMLLMVLVTVNLNWNPKATSSIQESDSNGYYAYLPAVFIYHDLHFGFFEEMEAGKYRRSYYLSDFRFKADGGKLNKFLCGTALAQLPFFLVTHGYCLLSGAEADGYSKPYSRMVTVAALFHLLMGLWCFDKLLKAWNVDTVSRSITLILIAFGTQLFNYAVIEPGMSHVYSFGFVSLFIYAAHRSLTRLDAKWLCVMAATLGMIVLIRPINALIVFSIPLLAGSLNVLVAWLKWVFGNVWRPMVAAFIFASFISIQVLYFQLASGHWWVDTYPGEGFNFADPHFIDILFSYKKGLFLYTPAFLIALVSAFWVWRKNGYKLLSYSAFFALITYFMSSWWNWWYGGSFSSRVYTEYIPLLFIPLAVLLPGIGQKQRFWLIGMLTLVVLLCQVQTYQYRYYIIHWENMDADLYWKHFLQLKP